MAFDPVTYAAILKLGTKLGDVIPSLGGVGMLPLDGSTYLKTEYPDLANLLAENPSSQLAIYDSKFRGTGAPSSKAIIDMAVCDNIIIGIVDNNTTGSAVISTDSGTTWRSFNLPSPSPYGWKCITTNDVDTFVVMGSGGIGIVSTDKGSSWNFLTIPPIPNSGNYSIFWAHNRFVGVGSTGQVILSNDGIDWITTTILPMNNTTTNGIRQIVWNGSYFLATPWSGTVDYLAKSVDGYTWTTVTMPIASTWQTIKWNGTIWAVSCSSLTDNIYSSADGINWTSSGQLLTLSNMTSQTSSLSEVNGTFIYSISGYASTTYLAADDILISTDGITWTNSPQISLGSTTAHRAGFATDGTTLIHPISGTPFVGISTDLGVTWTYTNLGASANWKFAICQAPNCFCIVADHSLLTSYTTDGGITWTTSENIPPTANIWSAEMGNYDVSSTGTIIICFKSGSTNGAKVLRTTDMITWTVISLPSSTSDGRIVVMKDTTKWIIHSNEALLYSSNDGTSWSTGTRPTGVGSLVDLIASTTQFLYIGASNIASYSTTGATWTTVTLPTTVTSSSMGFWTGSKFVILIGNTNVICLQNTAANGTWTSSTASIPPSISFPLNSLFNAPPMIYGSQVLLPVYSSSSKLEFITSDLTDLVTYTKISNAMVQYGMNNSSGTTTEIWYADNKYWRFVGPIFMLSSSDLFSWNIEPFDFGLMDYTIYSNGMSAAKYATNGSISIIIPALSGCYFRSTDNINWTRYPIPEIGPGSVGKLHWTGTHFIGVMTTGSVNSTDGLTWTYTPRTLKLATAPYTYSTVKDGKVYAVPVNTSMTVEFTDGVEWKTHALVYSPKKGQGMAYDAVNNILVAGGSPGVSISKDQGLTWSTNSQISCVSVAYCNGNWVATTSDPASYYISTDLINWSFKSSPYTNVTQTNVTQSIVVSSDDHAFRLVVYDANISLIMTTGVYMSMDGVNWTLNKGAYSTISNTKGYSTFGFFDYGADTGYINVVTRTSYDPNTEFVVPLVSTTPTMYVKAVK